MTEEIDLENILIMDEGYLSIKKNNLFEVLDYFSKKSCEIIFKVNNNEDILIGFLHKNKTA